MGYMETGAAWVAGVLGCNQETLFSRSVLLVESDSNAQLTIVSCSAGETNRFRDLGRRLRYGGDMGN